MTRRRYRLILPIAVLLPLVWLMVGCFYVPWIPLRTDRTRPDYRDLVGDPGSNRPIRVGVSRAQIIALLGPPELVSTDPSDLTSIGYSVETVTGYWVYPLCVTAFEGSDHTDVVRFRFDAAGTLVSFDTAHAGGLEGPLPLGAGPGYYFHQQAIQKLSHNGSTLQQAPSSSDVPTTTRP